MKSYNGKVQTREADNADKVSARIVEFLYFRTEPEGTTLDVFSSAKRRGE